VPTPTERQKTQFYAQSYFEQMPAGGEIVISTALGTPPPRRIDH
jgi:polyphosphate kinase 2 (PPK2 family)